MKKIILSLIFIISLFLVGCASDDITEEQARETALSFASQYGKFGVNVDGEKQEVVSKTIEIISAKKENDMWYVTLMVSTEINGSKKTGDLTVIINNQNKIIDVQT